MSQCFYPNCGSRVLGGCTGCQARAMEPPGLSRDERVAYARHLSELAASRQAEANRLRAVIRETEAEASRIYAQARIIMAEAGFSA